jgi:hypothetical protein
MQEQLPNGETYSDLNTWITDVLGTYARNQASHLFADNVLPAANGSAVYPNVNARWVNTTNGAASSPPPPLLLPVDSASLVVFLADPNLYFVNTGDSCHVNVTFVYETASYRPKLSYFSFNRTTSQQITNAVLIFNETSVDCQANNRSCLEPGSTVYLKTSNSNTYMP